MILPQLTRLLSVPPGDLVYHLVVWFAIWAILMLASGEGRRSNWQSYALRVTLAAVGLLILRGASVIVALLSVAGVTDPAWLAPPLERFASVASLGLLAWAFLLWAEDYSQAGGVLVAINTVGGTILYGLLGPQWYQDVQTTGAFYNAAPANWVWSVWAIALAALASTAAVVRRRAHWEMLVAAFSLLLLGHLLHLLYADPQAHVAGWVRLAELCAYPLLVGLMLARTAERKGVDSPPLPATLAVSAPWTAIEACQRVAEATHITVAVQRAGMAISNVLGTDVLAIGLLNKTGDTIDLAAVCRAGSAPRSGPTFDAASQLPIQSALNRKRASLVDVDQETQRATLAALVGGASGPLWVQPLVHQRMAVGILIAGRSTQRTAFAWTASEVELLNGLCGIFASALSAGQTNAALAQQVDQLQQQLRDRETALTQTEAKAQQLSAQLVQAEAQHRRAPQPIPSRPEHVQVPRPAEPKPAGEPDRLPGGEKTLRVRIKLDANSLLKSARAMMVLSHVKRVGHIIACQPVEADLRSGGFDDEFTVTFATTSEPSAVRNALISIRDVIGVEVEAI